jgi:hypothetical protein
MLNGHMKANNTIWQFPKRTDKNVSMRKYSWCEISTLPIVSSSGAAACISLAPFS